MDGLLTYADIFAKWIEGLSHIWDIMNMSVISLLTGVVTALPLSNAASAPLQVAGYALISLLKALGIGHMSLLTFCLSVMGTGFAIYFLLTLVAYVFDILP